MPIKTAVYAGYFEEYLTNRNNVTITRKSSPDIARLFDVVIKCYCRLLDFGVVVVVVVVASERSVIENLNYFAISCRRCPGETFRKANGRSHRRCLVTERWREGTKLGDGRFI